MSKKHSKTQIATKQAEKLKTIEIKGMNDQLTKVFVIEDETPEYVIVSSGFLKVQLNGERTYKEMDKIDGEPIEPIPKMSYFNANQLMKTLIYGNKQDVDQLPSRLTTSSWIAFLDHLYGYPIKYLHSVNGKFPKHREYSGKYIPIDCLIEFVFMVDPIVAIGWFHDIDLRDGHGYIYLMHSDDLPNDVWKLGETWNPKQRIVNGYKRQHVNPQYYFILSVSDRKKAEEIFKEVAKNSGATNSKLKDLNGKSLGKEYYRYKDCNQLIETIENTWDIIANGDDKLLGKEWQNYTFRGDEIEEIFNQ